MSRQAAESHADRSGLHLNRTSALQQAQGLSADGMEENMNVETVIFIVVMTCLFLLVIVSFLVASSMFVYHLYMNFKNAPPKQLARQAIAPAAEPAQATIPGRNPYYTPVMVLSGNVPGKDFYAILAFVPPGHQQTNVMRQEFLKAVQGLADYSIITEQVALEKGLRYGGVAYLSELNIPKVV